jgi:hypothetical protein
MAYRSNNTNNYVTHYATIPNKDTAEVLVFDVSGNDGGAGIADGTISSKTPEELAAEQGASLDNTTKIGAMEYIMSVARYNNPNIKFLVVTCPMLQDGSTGIINYGILINGLVKDLQTKWGFTVCDCYNQVTPVNTYNSHIFSGRNNQNMWAEIGNEAEWTKTNQQMFWNHTHPNEKGYRDYFVPAIAYDLVKLLDTD